MASPLVAETPWRLINPLPRALHHYTIALAETLAELGIPSLLGESASSELSHASVARRSVAGLRLLTERWQLARSAPEAPTLVLWAALGLWDPWRLPVDRTWLVLHDPRPLRPQVGYGRTAGALSRPRMRRGLGVIVHSAPAAADVRRLGWPSCVQLPHPIRVRQLPELSTMQTAGDVLVLGTAKTERDLAALASIARSGSGQRLLIRGRGWPAVSGWDVDDTHLDEGTFDQALSSAACVVIPYRRFYASGVAVRALEQLTPVVGPRHPQLEELLGVDWPGLVQGDDWVGAVERAQRVSQSALIDLRTRYLELSLARWGEFAANAGRRLPAVVP